MKNIAAIIPNYNYATLLERRIKSIVNQTVKPSEIIFLDDCSTDNSLQTAENLLSQCDIPWRIIKNDCNQGVFKQWLKGINLAQSTYLWIAEADDYCELDFLEKLLVNFDEENVVLAYCQSKFVDENGEKVTDYYHYMKRYFDHYIWDKSYIANGTKEIEKHLCCINTIPNASAVLFNKSLIDLNKISRIGYYSNNGDWLFYILCLSAYPENKISYYSETLNYFVRQQASVFVNDTSSTRPIVEFLEIIMYLLENFNIHKSEKSVMLRSVIGNLIYWPIDNDIEELVSTIMDLLPQDNLYQIYNQETKQIISRLKHKIQSDRNRLNERDEYILKLENTLEYQKNKNLFYWIKSKVKELLTAKWR